MGETMLTRPRRVMTDSAKKDLVNALAALVKERGLCAQLLSKPYERGTYDATMAWFVEFQTAIEAVERSPRHFINKNAIGIKSYGAPGRNRTSTPCGTRF